MNMADLPSAVERCCTVTLTDLEVNAKIGAYAHELGRRQTLIIDIDVEVDPPVEDFLEATLDFVLLSQIATTIADNHITLVETFAQRIALGCLSRPGVIRVAVSVRKPGALSCGVAGARVVMSNAFRQSRQVRGHVQSSSAT